jgi:TctA family transporter
MTEQEFGTDYRGSYLARSLITFLMNAALVIAPGFLGVLAIFFVVQAFGVGLGSGLRSFAAVIFPLMVLAFVKAGHITGERRRTINLPELPIAVEVAAMAVVGVASMMLLELSTSVPVVELVMAAGFSFIVYVLSEGRDRAAPYCLGLVIGSLGYVILVGVPQF